MCLGYSGGAAVDDARLEGSIKTATYALPTLSAGLATADIPRTPRARLSREDIDLSRP